MGTTSGPRVLGERATRDEFSVARRFVKQAKAKGYWQSGHHNDNFVLAVTEQVAPLLGCDVGMLVTVRIPREDALPVVIRTWQKESEILAGIRELPHVPTCLLKGQGFAIHSYVEGVPVEALCRGGRRMDLELVEALTALLAQSTLVSPEALPCLPPGWPRNHRDSRAFLKHLVLLADQQIRIPNWARFGGLFTALGVPEDALSRFAENVPEMTPRPYKLLHTDLHRGNVIVSYAGAALDSSALIGVDWELASYGDPLHDLATHLIRTGYPPDQHRDVISMWTQAMQVFCAKAIEGVENDLPRYVAFERAQSVYPDVMRAAQDLLQSPYDQESLDVATTTVRDAVLAAAEPLKLNYVPQYGEIERTLQTWRSERRRSAGGDRRRRPAAAVGWERDRRFPSRPDFPDALVQKVLTKEAKVRAERVFKGSAHRNSMVWVPEYGMPVVVRRRLKPETRAAESHLSENAVLREIEEQGAAVCAPRVLAVGATRPWNPFAIHTYEVPQGEMAPEHPKDGLTPSQTNALIEQLGAVTEMDAKRIDPLSCAEDFSFFDWYKERVLLLVRGVSGKARELAGILGLPDADGLEAFLDGLTVSPRKPALVHGDLSPWNLVLRRDELELTLIDWDMALIGDPLYDLVRHQWLTPTSPGIRETMRKRWKERLDPEFTANMDEDWPVYWKTETIRSAYVDLEHLVARTDRRAASVDRVVDSYGRTLLAATRILGLPPRRPANPYLAHALR